MPAAPVEPDTFWGDWRTLSDLRARQRARSPRGGRRWPVVVGLLPLMLAGYLGVAGVVASLLPSAALPPDAVLGLACAAILARACARGADAAGPTLTRGGLTALLVAPVSRRALMAEWVAGEVLAATTLTLGLMVVLAVATLRVDALPRAGGILVGAVACAAASVGVRGAMGIAAGGLPAWPRRALSLAGHGGAAAGAVAVGGALLGAKWIAEGGALHDLARLAATAGAPFAAAMAAPGVSATWLLALATAGVCGALPIVTAPLADGLQLLLASAREAAQRRPDRSASPGRPARTPAFGRGAASLVWKAMAERHAGAVAPRPALGWLALLVGGLAVAAWGATAAPLGPEAPVGVAIAVVVVGVPLGGRGSPGLATELLHPGWLLRLPANPARALAALLAPPALRLAAAAALLALPLALQTPGALPATLAAVAAGAVVAFAAHIARARCWLQEPPWQSGDAEAAHAEVRALAGPPALALAVGAVAWLGAKWPPPLVLAAAAAPAALSVAAAWPALLRDWARLELAPRVAADPRAA